MAEHPLQYTWTLWTDGQSKKKVDQQNWEANVKHVADFATVEEFWGVFNNILEPSQMDLGINYHLFRKGIMPKWEDPANEHGGKWVLTNPKSKNKMLDELWMNTILGIIGENYREDENRDICGIVLSIRRGRDRISVWTASAENGDLQMSIGRAWKTAVTQNWPNSDYKLEYMCHKASMAANSSYENASKYNL